MTGKPVKYLTILYRSLGRPAVVGRPYVLRVVSFSSDIYLSDRAYLRLCIYAKNEKLTQTFRLSLFWFLQGCMKKREIWPRFSIVVFESLYRATYVKSKTNLAAPMICLYFAQIWKYTLRFTYLRELMHGSLVALKKMSGKNLLDHQ